MNKTYRSVWNDALGAWVATSELGGGRRKGAQRAAVTVAMVLLTMGAAQAQTHYYDVEDGGTQQGNYNNNGATGANSLAAGVGAAATAANATAVGAAAQARGAGTIALGNGAIAGDPAQATIGANAVAIG